MNDFVNIVGKITQYKHKPAVLYKRILNKKFFEPVPEILFKKGG